MNILITGGASGLGNAITRELSDKGDNQVWFTYNNSAEEAAELASELKNVHSIKCDFTNPNDMQYLIQTIGEIGLDILIHNAFSGDFLKSHFNKIEIHDFESDFKANILPVIAITQAAISLFRKKKSGKIITILTSALINTPPVGSSVYVAGKAYLSQLSKIWATENARFNISSNTVSPAFMQTKFTSSVDERVIEQLTDSHPLKQLLQPEEVARAVLFLVNASPQINGTDIVINAGTSLK